MVRAAAAKPQHAAGNASGKPALRKTSHAPAARSAAKQAAAAGQGAAPPPVGTSGLPGKPARPPTPFEARLYAVTKRIPAGRVATYGALAAVLGSSARACGQALRRNPFAPTVPCHRVIAASLELGGFSGSWGNACSSVQKKRALLASEGVPFDDAGHLLKLPALMSVDELRAASAGIK